MLVNRILLFLRRNSFFNFLCSMIVNRERLLISLTPLKMAALNDLSSPWPKSPLLASNVRQCQYSIDFIFMYAYAKLLVVSLPLNFFYGFGSTR